MLPLVLAALPPTPVNLDSLSLDRARLLSGRPVLVTFVVAKPTYTLLGRTVAAAADRDDGAERGAVLRGRVRIDEGKRSTVVGVLTVRDHKAARVGNAIVSAWTEVRVEN